MNMALVIAVLLGTLQTDTPSNLGDGFYLLSLNAPGPPVKIYDRTFYAVDKLDLTVLQAEIRSFNNANTKFNLWVTIPLASLPEPPVALFVGGIANPSLGKGSDGKTAQIEFPNIDGRRRAEQVASFFNIQAILRRHPQHELEVSFKPVKEEFQQGQRASVIFHIRNIGENVIAFRKGGRDRAARDNQYAFSCRLNGIQVDDIGNSGHLGGLSVVRTLKPGEVFEEEVDLSKWFAFDKPGVYELLGSYYMAFMDPDTDLPPVFPIWEDYATADFSVKIN
jgi:hypothetical protein